MIQFISFARLTPLLVSPPAPCQDRFGRGVLTTPRPLVGRVLGPHRDVAWAICEWVAPPLLRFR